MSETVSIFHLVSDMGKLSSPLSMFKYREVRIEREVTKLLPQLRLLVQCMFAYLSLSC